MGRFDLVENLGLDPKAAFLWAVAIGSGIGLASSGIATHILHYSRQDWRKDYMYKPDYPYTINLCLLLSRITFLLVGEIILTDNTNGWVCTFQALTAAIFDVYASLMLLSMVVSTTRDAVTMMLSYPETNVTKQQLGQLLRMSAGGALGLEVDPNKLRDGILAQRRQRMDGDSSSTSAESEFSDSDYEGKPDLKDVNLDEELAQWLEKEQKETQDNERRLALGVEEGSMLDGNSMQSAPASEIGSETGSTTQGNIVKLPETNEGGTKESSESENEGDAEAANDQDDAPKSESELSQEEEEEERSVSRQEREDQEEKVTENEPSQSGSGSEYSGSYESGSEDGSARSDSQGSQGKDAGQYSDSETSAAPEENGLKGGGRLRGGARRTYTDTSASSDYSRTETRTFDNELDETIESGDEFYSDEDSWHSSDEDYLSDDEDDFWSSEESETESTESDSDEGGGLEMGFFGFFCGGADIPAAKQSRKEIKRIEREERARKLGITDEDFEKMSRRSGSRRSSRRGSVAGSVRSFRTSRSRTHSRAQTARTMTGASDAFTDGFDSDVFPEATLASRPRGKRAREAAAQKAKEEVAEEAARPGGLLTLSYPARVAEMMRSVVTRPVMLMSAAHLAKGYLREHSRWELPSVRQFIAQRIRRGGLTKPAKDLDLSQGHKSFVAFCAVVLSTFPLASGSYGFIGFVCQIQETSTSGKTWLVILYYGPIWLMFFLSQALHFCLRLVKTYSYPATANGPHQLEVAIRRLAWYPVSMAACFIYPTAHAYYGHQHQTLAELNADVALTSMLHVLSLYLVNVFFAMGIMIVEIHLGVRDRYIVRGDPLLANPVPKEMANVEPLPPHMQLPLARDRFFLLMNALEERKHTMPGGACKRCNLHSHRLNLKVERIAGDLIIREEEFEDIAARHEVVRKKLIVPDSEKEDPDGGQDGMGADEDAEEPTSDGIEMTGTDSANGTGVEASE